MASKSKKKSSSSSKSSSSKSSSSNTVKYDAKTGKKLKSGQSTTDAMGNTFKQGDTFNSSKVKYSSSSGGSSSSTTQNTQQTQGFSLTAGNLKQGSTGEDVKKLQTALGITADGIYGPKTAEAVKAYQAKNGLASDGIVGPNTVAALNKNSASIPQASMPVLPVTPITIEETEEGEEPPLNEQLGLLGAIGDVSTTLAGSQNAGLTLAEALEAAKKDPNIIAKYSDALKLDTQSFAQQLEQLQMATSDEMRKYQTQFENDRRQLAENSAAAGQAYSGLRNRAQQQLGEAETGIVSSSRNALKKSLQDLTTAFETKYGTGSAKVATAQFKDPLTSSTIGLSGLNVSPAGNTSTLSGQLAGGITGTQPIAKNQEILTKATSLYDVGKLPDLSGSK